MLEQGPANKGENPAMPSTSEWQASRGIDPAANKEAREASSSHIAAGSAEELFGGTEDNTDSNRMEYLTLSELTDLYVDANDILAGGEDNAEAQATQEAVEAEAERRYDYIKATAGEDAAEAFMDIWDSIISPEDDSDTELEAPQAPATSLTRRSGRGGKSVQNAKKASMRRDERADLDAASQEAVDELNLESPDEESSAGIPTSDEIIDGLDFEGASDEDLAEIAAQAKAAKAAGSISPTADKLVDRTLSKAKKELSRRGLLDSEEAEGDSQSGFVELDTPPEDFIDTFQDANGVFVEAQSPEDSTLKPNEAIDQFDFSEAPGDNTENNNVPPANNEEGTLENVYNTRANKFKQDEKIDTTKLKAIRKEHEQKKARRSGADKWQEPGEPGKYLPEVWQPDSKPKEKGTETNTEKRDSKTTAIELWQPVLIEKGAEDAIEKYIMAATEVRLSDNTKKGGKVRKLLSKIPYIGNRFETEESGDLNQAMEDAEAEMDRIINNNGIAVAMNERARLFREGKTEAEIDEHIKGLSALGDLKNQESITWAMDKMAADKRKTSGFLGRWFNDLDKEGNAKGSNKFVKFMKKAASVGIVAGGAGAAIGFGLAFTPFVGAAGLAVNIIGGAGATVMGSKIGKNIARSGYMQQNRTKGSDDDSFKQSIDENGFRNLGFGISNEVKLEQESNTKLVNTAKKIGELTALLGFMGGNIAGNLLESYINNPFKGWSQAQMDAFARMVQGPEQFQQYSNMVNSGVYSPKEIGNILDLSWKMMGSPANPGFSGYTSSLLDKLIQPLLTNNISTTLGWTTAGPNVLNVTNALVNGSLVAA